MKHHWKPRLSPSADESSGNLLSSSPMSLITGTHAMRMGGGGGPCVLKAYEYIDSLCGDCGLCGLCGMAYANARPLVSSGSAESSSTPSVEAIRSWTFAMAWAMRCGHARPCGAMRSAILQASNRVIEASPFASPGLRRHVDPIGSRSGHLGSTAALGVGWQRTSSKWS